MKKNKVTLFLCSFLSFSVLSNEYLLIYKSDGVKGYETGDLSFSANKTTINNGDSTTLSWNVSANPKTISISGIGNVSAKGTISVSPTVSTDYILTESDGLKTETKTVHIDVLQHFLGENSITTSSSLINIGESIVLNWSVGGEPDSIQITPTIGTVAKTGSIAISPLVDTDYVLTVTANGVSQTKTSHVNVNQYVMGDIALTADKSKITKGDPLVLSWNVTNNPQTVDISGGVGTVAKSGSLTIYPSVTTDYILTQTVNGVTTTKTIHVLVQDNSSCYTLHQTDPSLVDGIYTLKSPNGMTGSYSCDMTNGGWTRLAAYDQLPSTLSPFTKITTGNTGWWARFAGTAAGVYRDRGLNFNVNEKFKWTQSKISITALSFSTIDGFTNTHGNAVNRSVLSGMYVDGLSFTRVNSSSIYNHIYTITDSNVNSLGIPTSQIGVLGSNTSSANYAASFSTIYNAGSEINDYIKFRAITDEDYNNEDVGFSAMQVWIK